MAKLSSKEREAILMALQNRIDEIDENNLVEEEQITASEAKALNSGFDKLKEIFVTLYK